MQKSFPSGDEIQMSALPRKTLRRIKLGGAPYRKPTQVGWCEYTKVNESIFVKELGKKAFVRSQYELPR